MGFAPIARRDARVLILGTLPGAASLAAGEYYAQRRNAFWRIMGELVGAGPDHPYDVRCARLKDAGVALWDVCASAVRPGSLDTSIDRSSVIVNDLAGFLASHRRIRLIAFNGATAASLFVRHHGRDFLEARGIRQVRLPSTSPAHAAMPLPEKCRAWRLGLEI